MELVELNHTIEPDFHQETDRDCDCITHTGPHWKHMDDVWHKKNMKLLKIASDVSQSINDRKLAFYAFAVEEEQRLREKEWHMKFEE